MDVIKNELIEYSNKRSNLVKFSDYDDYIYSQVIQGKSHTSNSGKISWTRLPTLEKWSNKMYPRKIFKH